jgi:hypothetical protein
MVERYRRPRVCAALLRQVITGSRLGMERPRAGCAGYRAPPRVPARVGKRRQGKPMAGRRGRGSRGPAISNGQQANPAIPGLGCAAFAGPLVPLASLGLVLHCTRLGRQFLSANPINYARSRPHAANAALVFSLLFTGARRTAPKMKPRSVTGGLTAPHLRPRPRRSMQIRSPRWNLPESTGGPSACAAPAPAPRRTAL